MFTLSKIKFDVFFDISGNLLGYINTMSKVKPYTCEATADTMTTCIDENNEEANEESKPMVISRFYLIICSVQESIIFSLSSNLFHLEILYFFMCGVYLLLQGRDVDVVHCICFSLRYCYVGVSIHFAIVLLGIYLRIPPTINAYKVYLEIADVPLPKVYIHIIAKGFDQI